MSEDQKKAREQELLGEIVKLLPLVAECLAEAAASASQGVAKLQKLERLPTSDELLDAMAFAGNEKFQAIWFRYSSLVAAWHLCALGPLSGQLQEALDANHSAARSMGLLDGSPGEPKGSA